eukprot:CAMPEP_0115840602 /NCGR_PEP_ID=MMETSP0287-20121206/6856_1 /TAXON_ID=412157 /ORGANISM="Chrysochromulina rotalis, Strain UIO044" /LENGTH=100 /DNA_ID=CAMNT_0003294219 /DNA_START=965 /DNA_END=1267 /DNA_ORIENTATION=-
MRIVAELGFNELPKSPVPLHASLATHLGKVPIGRGWSPRAVHSHVFAVSAGWHPRPDLPRNDVKRKAMCGRERSNVVRNAAQSGTHVVCGKGGWATTPQR